MPEPIYAQVYRKLGFLFQVDFVDADEVYVARWKESDGHARFNEVAAIRVKRKTWDRQMKDAELVTQ